MYEKEIPEEDEAAVLTEDDDTTIVFTDPRSPFAPTIEVKNFSDIVKAGSISLMSTGATSYMAVYDLPYSYSFPASAPAP